MRGLFDDDPLPVKKEVTKEVKKEVIKKELKPVEPVPIMSEPLELDLFFAEPIA